MSFEAFFTFVVNHNVVIFQWLVVCVLATAMLYLGLRIFAKDKLSSEDVVIVERSASSGKRGASASATASPIAPSVDEIMAQPGMSGRDEPLGVAGAAATPSADGGSAGMAGGAVGLDASQLAGLQDELTAKELEIATLKSEIENAKGSELDSADMKAKLEELEAKLAEYEILEDDIADLSHFKEENARLKEELEALKSGGAVPATSSDDDEPADEDPEAELVAFEEADEQAADDEPEVSEDDPDKRDLMAEFEASLGAEDLEEESAQDDSGDDTGEDASGPLADDGADFVAEFEAAVQQQKGPDDEEEDEVTTIDAETPPAPEVKAKAPPKSEPKSSPEPASKARSEGPEDDEDDPSMPTGDDILAEFAQSLGSEETEDEANAAETGEGIDGALDTDKVLAEMADLATAATTTDGGSALEEEMDTEKMAEEASRLLNGE